MQPREVQQHQQGETVVLSQIDSRGRVMQGAMARGEDPSGKTEHSFLKEKRPKAFLQRHGEDGQKDKWFRDDDNKTLDDLVTEAKRGGASMDENYADAIVRQARYGANGCGRRV